ncbi:MAG: class I SAM-dependent methyltransferase, partial [Chitinivibrionales bacterium]
VLDLGCGYGSGICNIVKHFGSKGTAVDISPANIELAKNRARETGVDEKIEFIQADIKDMDLSDKKYDLILAEGGILSFIGRSFGLNLCRDLVKPGGRVSFSDLILLGDDSPDEVLDIFQNEIYHYETEDTYRKLLNEYSYNIELMALVPPSGWDNYYAHMSRRLEDSQGFFAEKNVKNVFYKEIDIFYRHKGSRYIGYLYGVVEKED